MCGEVLAGDFEGCLIRSSNSYLYIDNYIEYTFTKNNISSYEIVSQDTTKSTSSALTRGIIGGALLGPIGLLAGLGAKNKNCIKIAVYWKDGKKSLIQLTSASQIETFYKCMF